MPFIVHSKFWLGQILCVSDKTLHLVVGLALFFLFLKFTKSPGWAIFGLYAVELVNEINDAIVAYPNLSTGFWLDISTDFLATMIMPCLTAVWMLLKRRSSVRSS